MSNFNIEFTGDFLEDDPLVALGVIRIGSFRESFSSILGFWSLEDYRANWITATRRLLGVAEVSCLLTSVPNPAKANFFTVWPLYRSGDHVYVQNQLIFADDLNGDFDPDAPWQYVEPRTTIDEDGTRISEWQVSSVDIEEFVAEAAR
jgi:hypothetical protein